MSPPRIRHCRLLHSPTHPGTEAGEDPHHQKPHEITAEHAHKVLLPRCDESEHDAPISHRLIGAYRYDTCMYVCPYAPHRRCRGVGRGQPLTDPSPGTIPRICSPFPALVTSSPSPFKFAQESCFLDGDQSEEFQNTEHSAVGPLLLQLKEMCGLETHDNDRNHVRYRLNHEY